MAIVPRLHDALNALVIGIVNAPGLTRGQIVAGAVMRGWDGNVIGLWVDTLAQALFDQGSTDDPAWNTGVRPRAIMLGGERAAKALLKAIADTQGTFTRTTLLAQATEAGQDATLNRRRAVAGDAARTRLLATQPTDADLITVLDLAGFGVIALNQLADVLERATLELQKRAGNE